MARIQPLPEHVVAQIAAGEVIERPASVLKELLENSVDAGSTRVDVEVGQGGLEFLRVADNGCGIDAADLPLAFAAHATSKLRSADDLFHIGTLGFRGEGLASIGSVAQVCLQSRPAGADRGAEVRCHGGHLSEVRVWNGAPGTRIEVRHLFYNTPVRRKFLRGPATEMGQVAEVFTRLALSQLSLHLNLRHNGKLVHEVPSSAGLLDRIALFFGEELRGRLLMVEAEQGATTLGGYVADPLHEAGGAQMQYLFVNGRWVRDRLVSQALQEAYRGLLLTGKHPIAFLFLELPPDSVDVNVHPTKAEVRFRQPEKVQQLVIDVVRKRLQGTDLTAPLRVRQASAAPAPAEQGDLPFAADQATVSERRGGEEARSASEGNGRQPPPPIPTPRSPEGKERTPVPASVPVKARAPEKQPVSPAVEKNAQPLPEVRRGSAPVAPPSPPPRPPRAVQMHELYLVVEVPEGILIVDQHALHERILFEQLRERLAEGRLEVQHLLVPEPVNLPPAQAALLLAHREALAELGLQVDDFGGGTVLLGSYPAVLGKKPPRDVLGAVVEYLTRQERPPTREVLLNDLMALVACHTAVRAGDRLSQEQIAALVEKRHLAQDAHHCPHGRPSSLLLTRQDLDRQFRRT
jgi:DNA mismatch repair protein MutL